MIPDRPGLRHLLKFHRSATNCGCHRLKVSGAAIMDTRITAR